MSGRRFEVDGVTWEMTTTARSGGGCRAPAFDLVFTCRATGERVAATLVPPDGGRLTDDDLRRALEAVRQ